MQNLFNDLAKILEKDERLFAEGKLLKNVITELAIKLDGNLFKLLLKNKQTKEHFFIEVEGVLVFNQDKFIKFINNKEFLPNSFTAFKNHIGLSSEGEYLKDGGNVVLAWPYKDCVLEGGQDKEDVGRNEIFYNEILAPDEIDRLFESKVLTNIKKIDKTGEYKIEQITEQDNLIIKGNNLLALHTIKRKYQNKVKLIYIDPPYNTGNDGFKYNDSFNHSSWLIFIKNRLEVAKQLLRNDGVIFVQCDDNEQAYLKILMDEIFGRENFLATFVWQKKSSGSQHSKHILDFHEYITVFSKNLSTLPEFAVQRTDKQKESFKLEDEYIKERGKYLLSPLKSWLDYRKTLIYPITCPDNSLVETQWVCANETFNKLKEDGRIVFNKTKNGEWTIYKKQYENDRGGEVKPPSLLLDVAQNMQGTKEIQELFGEKLFANPKPEKLLQFIIEMSTKKTDIVLDFFSGSGTTLAVAHKMERQYIGIEQMDYIHDLPEARLKKVIAGEQGGISKNINWQGGGSFIYAELKEWNETYMKEIREAKTSKEMGVIYKKMQTEAFMRYEIDLSKFDQKQLSELALEDQKQLLLKCLDKNHLYVNYGDIDDATYKISPEEKKLNKLFYGN